jgi:hypothetical protein
VAEIAARHGVSDNAATALFQALAQGHGSQAQFSHPELGGMGQWSQGGMIMVGDMFNHGLKARVDALCQDLAMLLREQPLASSTATSLFAPQSGAQSMWWPADLGHPGSTGAQNDMRYAYFPDTHRLVIQRGGETTIYDTGAHSIFGFGQQQSGDQSLTFTSQFGVVPVASLTLVGGPPPAPISPAKAEPPARVAPDAAAPASQDIFKLLDQLAALHQKNVLTDDEFTSKKAELLARL